MWITSGPKKSPPVFWLYSFMFVSSELKYGGMKEKKNRWRFLPKGIQIFLPSRNVTKDSPQKLAILRNGLLLFALPHTRHHRKDSAFSDAGNVMPGFCAVALSLLWVLLPPPGHSQPQLIRHRTLEFDHKISAGPSGTRGTGCRRVSYQLSLIVTPTARKWRKKMIEAPVPILLEKVWRLSALQELSSVSCTFKACCFARSLRWKQWDKSLLCERQWHPFNCLSLCSPILHSLVSRIILFY